MNIVKEKLRKYNKLYAFLQKVYHWFRKIVETYFFGTKIRKFVWKKRGDDWAKDVLCSISDPHRKILIDKISLFSFESVLEIGCASGPNLVLLAKKYPEIRIKGIDPNEKAIKIGKEYLRNNDIFNVDLSISSTERLKEIPDKSFDIVFTDAVLLYVASDKINEVKNEMLRIAKKAIIMVEHHSNNESGLGSYRMGNWVRDYEKLFYGKEIKFNKIGSNVWSGDWSKIGYIIEVIL